MRNAVADAGEDYERLLAREPDSLRFAEYADHLRKLQRLPQAIAVCEDGLARHPGYCTGRVVMAQILSDAGQPEPAAKHLRDALRLDPHHPRAHLLLGGLLLAQGDREQAAAEFEAALVTGPGLAEAQAGLREARGDAPVGPAGARQHAGNGARAGQRPEWLTPTRSVELVALAAGCPAVETARVVDADGRILACSAAGDDEARPDQCAVGFVNDLRTLASRLGAGRVRSAAVCGTRTTALYLPLGDLLLVACVHPRAPLDAATAELQTAVTSGPQGEG